MSSPAVSVIVPVYNTKVYLPPCLDSLIEQSLREIEIICVDNGSSDGSYELLQDYAKNYSNIMVFRHPVGRQGDARNFGIENANGSYIGFVDSDDFVAPTLFEKLYKAAKSIQADVAVCNYSPYIDNEIQSYQGLPQSLLTTQDPFLIQQRPKFLRNLTPWNKLVRREFLETHQIQFPTDVFHEDQFFVVVVFVLARCIVSVPEALYFYQKERPGSVNMHRGPDSLHVFQVVQKTSKFLESKIIDKGSSLLINEVKTLKYLQLYQITGNKHKREYFEKMRFEFQNLLISDQPQILSSPETREFRFVQRSGYIAYNLFLFMRSLYRWFRSMIFA
jgi:glycosyltransferase involved in cell wall biosynthesis